MNNRLLLFRTARMSSRGGFTLVELLVVIGIIAILAGVALGPITNGLKKAKQSSGMQSAHALYLASFSYANDNSQVFACGADASNIALALLGGGYVTDASIFYIAGGTAVKLQTNALTTPIAIGNMSWDFMQQTATIGLSSSYGDYTPLLWSTIATGGGGAEPQVATATNPMTAQPGAHNPFGTDGIAVAYKSGASKFATSTYAAGNYTVTFVAGSDNINGITPVAIASGGG